ncbi:uncharacterized protein [Macaca fascicularis]|uniref:uncharacterized protein n=1 Tax=Macaca fascicularis TaxID=9541 RepID=UPI0032B0497E
MPPKIRVFEDNRQNCSSRGHQGPTSGTSPSGPRAPKHSPRRRGAGKRGADLATAGPEGRPSDGGEPAPPGAGRGNTDLSSPPRLGCGGRLTGRRRPRPPPPPATASFPFAAATAGAHAGPALPYPENEAGKGGAGAAEIPAFVASRRCLSTPGAAGPSCQGLQAASYSEEEPKEAPPPAAERAGSAEVKRAFAKNGRTYKDVKIQAQPLPARWLSLAGGDPLCKEL